MAVLNELTVQLRQCRGASDYPALVAIWRSAVDATHGFVAREDLDAIERALPADYLPALTVTVAELDGRPVGFSGVADERLEMLFVDETVRGQGIGSVLLEHALREQGVTTLDVNEQNADAVAFYTRRGFHIAGRSERDDDGRPYPLLHMHR